MPVDSNVPYPPQSPHVAAGVPGRHGAVFGAALVVTGSLALAVRLMPQVSLINAWPLFFFVVGIVQMVTPDWTGEWKPSRFAEGLGTLLFGTALLGCTLGYVRWDMWLTMLSLWPLLLVVAGLNVLSNSSGQKWIAFAATLMVWAALLFSAAGAWTGTYSPEPVPPVFSQQRLDSPDAVAQSFADTIVETVTGPMSQVTY